MLEKQFEDVRKLRFPEEEIAYLRRVNLLSAVCFARVPAILTNLELPPVTVKKGKDQFLIETSGAWPVAILWETIILGTVNELYYNFSLDREEFHLVEAQKEGAKRLEEKISILQAHPDIKIIEFGTRRRFSFGWQTYVLDRLLKKIPNQIIGTSNVKLAKEFNARPIGTFAHEMDMIFSGIFHGSDEEIRASHQKVLDIWWQEYGEPLSIALTDTYGSDFFFRDFTEEQAQNWRGLRQDSGDSIMFGEKAIAFYNRLGIDPREKLIVFSDGLDIRKIVEIAERFTGRIKVAFGWGTNLTNDLGLKPLSLIVKAIEANGYRTVKLSDNLAKAMGDKEDIDRFIKIFEYSNTFSEALVY